MGKKKVVEQGVAVATGCPECVIKDAKIAELTKTLEDTVSMQTFAAAGDKVVQLTNQLQSLQVGNAALIKQYEATLAASGRIKDELDKLQAEKVRVEAALVTTAQDRDEWKSKHARDLGTMVDNDAKVVESGEALVEANKTIAKIEKSLNNHRLWAYAATAVSIAAIAGAILF